jgi:hypothetical protein
MDTEEHIEIQKSISRGQPTTDEGPYYHETWWESYKGSVKGELGGAIIGGVVGAIVGGIAALTLPIFGASALLAWGTVAGFSAAGMWIGAERFSMVGIATGAAASVGEKAEERMKEFENGKFAEIKHELHALKAMISGKKAAAEVPPPPPEESSQPAHRMTHMLDHPEKGPPIFWKVALIGLAVGLAAGALLAFGHVGKVVLDIFHTEAALSTTAQFAATMIPMGLFGASFGINRDLFRRIFDKTDLWFKGLFISNHNGVTPPQQSVEKSKEKSESPSVVTVVLPGDDSPASTYHQDKYKLAKMALLNLDPSKTIRQ